jgi:hypothetical protein
VPDVLPALACIELRRWVHAMQLLQQRSVVGIAQANLFDGQVDLSEVAAAGVWLGHGAIGS